MIERDVLMGAVSLLLGLYLVAGSLAAHRILLQTTLVQWLAFAIGPQGARLVLVLSGLLLAAAGFWLALPHLRSDGVSARPAERQEMTGNRCSQLAMQEARS